MKKSKSYWYRLLFISLMVFSFSAYGENTLHPDVQKMIQANQEPEGVVFEVETLDGDALNKLAGYIKFQVEQVRKSYPSVDIAVVSHGVEEYALQTKKQPENAGLHSLFNNLVSDSEVSLHVCGAVAGLNKLSQEDFPEFVSYSESGMAQINDYKALDYQVIVIKQLSDKQRKTLFETPEKFM